MADINVGGGAGGGIGGIPTRYVAIGAGVLGVGVILLMQRRGAGAGEQQSYGANLGPNAALALGSLETRLAQESGNLQLLMRDYRDDLGDQLDAAAAALGDQYGVLGSRVEVYGQRQEEIGRYLANKAEDLDNTIRVYGNPTLAAQWEAFKAANPDTWRTYA